MIINIKSKFRLLARTYEISVNGVPTHRAIKWFFSFFSTVRLYEKDILKIKMIKEMDFFTENYDIILSDGVELIFERPSRKEAIYSCQVRNDYYKIYADRGPWVQVVKNDRLVAGWEQNDINFNFHDYQIRGDEDFDAEIVIAFCLICEDLQSINRNWGRTKALWDEFGDRINS